MDVTVNYREEDGIVWVKVSGIMDFVEHRRYCKETLSCAKKHSSHKIFVDMLEMTPQLTISETDQLPLTLIEYGATPEHKFAVLHNPPPPHDIGFAFFMDSAVTESLVIRPFENEQEALAWLKSESPVGEEKIWQH